MSLPYREKPCARLPLVRFSAFADLSKLEVEALEALAENPVTLPRGRILRAEGDPEPGLFLLHMGWIASSLTLPRGARQNCKIHCPGDVLGGPSLPLQRAGDTLISLTQVTVSTFAPHRLAALFARHPRLGMMFFLAAQVERTFLMDHLAALGRCSAEQRIAGFLIHIAERVQLTVPHVGAAFELPLTQRQIGDLLGLTPVHVNRVLKRFDLSGHIRRYRKWIELLRLEDLRQLSGLPSRAIAKNPSWLSALK